MVDEGAEAETVRPRGRKVGDFHVLEQDDIIELGNNKCSEVRMTYRGQHTIESQKHDILRLTIVSESVRETGIIEMLHI